MVAGDRADVDDDAFGGLQVADGGAGDEEDAAGVGGEDVFVEVERGFGERMAADEGAGVVDEDVEAAGLFDEGCDHFGDLGFVADVGLEHAAVGMLFYFGKGGLCAVFGLEVVDADKGALSGKGDGGGGADAGAGACDEDFFAFQIIVGHGTKFLCL